MDGTGSNFLDAIIATSIVLMILSLITEKGTNFIRKYWVRRSFSRKWGGSIWIFLFPNLRNKESGIRVEDDELTSQITVLSLVIGVIVAAAFKANAFELLLSDAPHETLGWNRFAFKYTETWSRVYEVFRTVFGIFLTGAFLSIGSKFFHDLLDNLLAIKNYKRKLYDEKTYQINDIDKLTMHIEENDIQMNQSAVVEYIEEHIHDEGVLSIGMTSIEINGVGYFTPQVNIGGQVLPPSLEAAQHIRLKRVSDENFLIPVQFIKNANRATIKYSPGDGLSPEQKKSERGTFGAIITDKDDSSKKYILTCSHVVLGGKATDRGGWLRASNAVSRKISAFTIGSNTHKRIGSYLFAQRDGRYDVALIDPNAFPDNDNRINGGRVITGCRRITYNDVRNRTKVQCIGYRSGHLLEGYLVGNLQNVEIEYDDISTRLSFLLAISANKSYPHQSITQGGDSGSILYDENYQAVGMVIAGNEYFTYAIPMLTILKLTNTKI